MTCWRALIGGAAALALSGALHAGALLIATPQDDAVQIADGGAPDIAALGAAFADFAAGSTPVTPAAQTAVTVPATSPNLTLPATANADLAVPVATSKAPVSPAATPIVNAVKADPVDTAPTTSLRPVARQPRPAPPAPAQTEGNAQTDANRGSAQGLAGGQATATGTPAQQDTGGQAAAANYPGAVLRQITRLRPPRAAARGTVMVSFAIDGSGALADVAVAQSSGSGALDQMALDHIRRAAPFPPPPAGAQTRFSFEFVGRSS